MADEMKMTEDMDVSASDGGAAQLPPDLQETLKKFEERLAAAGEKSEEEAQKAGPELKTKPMPANANAQAVVVNFMADVVQPGNKEGAGQQVVNAMNELLKYAMSLGFSQEQATRAAALWLIDLAWKILTMTTGIMGQAMLTMKMPQQAIQTPDGVTHPEAKA